MKDWIRWPGFVVFLLFTAVLVGGFYFFAGTLLKATIEYAGTEMVGAKVELDDADLTVSPLGFSLHNLQVTSPEDPMINVLHVGRINLDMNGLALLRWQVIIDEMHVEKVRLNTKRTHSGKIAEKQEAPSDASESFDFSMSSVELPNVNDILAKEKLESDRLVEEARLDMDKSQQKWDKKLNELPDKDTLDAYGETLNSIKPVKTGDKLKDLKALSDAIDELKKVKKNIKSDLSQLSSVGEEFRQDIGLMNDNFKAVLQAPAKDFANLKEKYSLSSSGVSNMSRLLFGETAAYWTRIALDWYERISPVLLKTMDSKEDDEKQQILRYKGINIKFKEQNPLPDLLIKSTRVSLELESGNLNGEVKDITSDQQILGRPTSFQFQNDNLQKGRQIKISGNFNHTKPGNSIDTTELILSNYEVSNFVVSKNKSFPLALSSAVMNMTLNGELKQGVLDANMSSYFKSADFDLPWDEKPGKLVKTIGESLQGVNAFEVKADLKGTLKDNDIDISSDLDDVIKNALGKQFKQKAQEFEKQLKDKVEQKTKEQIAKLESRLDTFNSAQQDLQLKKNNAEEKINTVDAKIDALIKEKENELNKKSQAAKDKSEKKLDERKDKLKDKLKDRFR